MTSDDLYDLCDFKWPQMTSVYFENHEVVKAIWGFETFCVIWGLSLDVTWGHLRSILIIRGH